LPLSTDFLGRDDDEEEFETDITPRESEAAANLRKRLTEFCAQRGGGNPNEILQQLVGHHGDFSELTDTEALRVHKDFESRYLSVEAPMD
jgi:hypothetical protein